MTWWLRRASLRLVSGMSSPLSSALKRARNCIWWIGDVAAVDGVDAEFAPLRLVEGGFLGVEFAIKEAALAADEVGVEVVGLEAVDDAAHCRCGHP